METYPVYFFPSNTSGEKLYEEFYTENEKVDFNRFSQLGVIEDNSKKSIAQIDGFIDQLEKLLISDDLDKETIVRFLADIVPNFEHIETGISLDQKM